MSTIFNMKIKKKLHKLNKLKQDDDVTVLTHQFIVYIFIVGLISHANVGGKPVGSIWKVFKNHLEGDWTNFFQSGFFTTDGASWQKAP